MGDIRAGERRRHQTVRSCAGKQRLHVDDGVAIPGAASGRARPRSRRAVPAHHSFTGCARLCGIGLLTGQYGRGKAELAGGARRRRLRSQVTKPRGLNNLSFSSRFLLTSSELRDNSFGTLRPHLPKMAKTWPVNGRNCACRTVGRLLRRAGSSDWRNVRFRVASRYI